MTWTELLLSVISASLVAVLVLSLLKMRRLYLQRQFLALDPLGNFGGEENANPGPGRSHSPSRVLLYGDSRAMGWTGLHLGGEDVVVNCGMWGQTSAQVLARVERDVVRGEASALILQVGVNDLKMIPLMSRHSETIIRRCIENIEAIVRHCRNERVRVILTTVFPVGTRPFWRSLYCGRRMSEAIRRVNAAISLMESEEVTILDTHRILADGDGLVKREYQDGFVHVNARAYQHLNEFLDSVLADGTLTSHDGVRVAIGLVRNEPPMRMPVPCPVNAM